MCSIGTSWGSKRIAIALVALVALSEVNGQAIAASSEACAAVLEMAKTLNSVKKMRLVNERIRKGGGIVRQDVVIVDWKQYSRTEDRPWRIRRRKLTPLDAITNCKFIGMDRTNGVDVTVHEYERHHGQTTYRVRVWIAKDSHLPVKSNWKEIKPNLVRSERDTTYIYDEGIHAPI